MTERLIHREPSSEGQHPDALLTMTPTNRESIFIRRLHPRVVLRADVCGLRIIMKMDSRDAYVCPRDSFAACEGLHSTEAATSAAINAAEKWNDPLSPEDIAEMHAAAEGLEGLNGLRATALTRRFEGDTNPPPAWVDPRWDAFTRLQIRGS